MLLTHSHRFSARIRVNHPIRQAFRLLLMARAFQSISHGPFAPSIGCYRPALPFSGNFRFQLCHRGVLSLSSLRADASQSAAELRSQAPFSVLRDTLFRPLLSEIFHLVEQSLHFGVVRTEHGGAQRAVQEEDEEDQRDDGHRRLDPADEPGAKGRVPGNRRQKQRQMHRRREKDRVGPVVEQNIGVDLDQEDAGGKALSTRSRRRNRDQAPRKHQCRQ